MDFIFGCMGVALVIAIGFFFLHMAFIVIGGLIALVVSLFCWIGEKIGEKK